MKIFRPRTFLLIWMLISLSLKRPTVAGCSSTPKYWQIDSARGRFPLPEKMLRVTRKTGRVQELLVVILQRFSVEHVTLLGRLPFRVVLFREKNPRKTGTGSLFSANAFFVR